MLFSETQKFRQTWFWAVLLVSFLSTSAAPLIELADYRKTGVFHWAVLLVFVVPVIIGLLFWFMGLNTSIDETGIKYHFILMGRPKEILWSDIDTAYVRKYKPLVEYGGWGLRYSFKNGRAINVSGDMGLQLLTKKGKKILIGTNRQDELKGVMEQLYKKGIVTNGSSASNITDRY